MEYNEYQEGVFITLCIHTYDRAVSLRRILEAHNISVNFENVILSGTSFPSAVRVKIEEHDLPHALRIVESVEPIALPGMDKIFKGTDGNLLIPVDFKPHTMIACRLGFDLARRLSLHPVLLHAYATPYFNGNFPFDETFIGSTGENIANDLSEVEISKDLGRESKNLMKNLRKKIEAEQKEGTIVSIGFSTMVNEGVAEDVIREYCRMTPPELVVMATRGKQKKGEELIGSVTAEVLDTCKVPVFSIPDNCTLENIEKVKKCVYFCNLDQNDIMTVDTFMRMFDYPEVSITLVPVNEKISKNIEEKVSHLVNYFNNAYPTAHFQSETFPVKNFMAEFYNYESQAGIELIIVPNRRRNIFARLLNPGIAHKLLFERDLPLLAIPV